MKPFILCLLVVFCGCAQGIYFRTPNDVQRKKGTILFNDSTTLSGLITIPFENYYKGSTFENYYKASISYPKYIQVIPDGKTAEDTVAVARINGYYMDSNFYALKSVFLPVDNTEHLLFVKRLTGQYSRIGLYYLHQTGKSTSAGEETEDYFITLPGSKPYETINTRSEKIVPYFDLKMSVLVSDCPALADKIRSKNPAYYFPFVTINRFKQRDVMLKIIDGYNNCK